MTKDALKIILEEHEKWIKNNGGKKANLSEANLRGANLSEADLRGADLSWANLSWADLSWANLSGADLRGANLSGAVLSGADLRGARLRGADLSGAELRGANLSETNQSWANLSEADLRGANLRGANLRGANLRGANLSGAEGLISAINYLEAHFERTDEGYIAYKIFGAQYVPPQSWKIEPNSVIEETVNSSRENDCGSGVNVAPMEWVRAHYHGEIWKVLIEWPWLAGVIVPYNTDGKIRCERVRLLEIVEG